MKIALPVSKYFEQVKSDLLPLIGAVFIREEKYMNEDFRNKEILFHANGFINDEFDELVNNRRFLEKADSCANLLSFDLGPSCRKVDCSEEGYVAKSSVLKERQILEIAEKKIANIRRYFKGIISVENLDYHPSGAYESVCDPGFISHFVESFDLGLTLDIGHVEVTCNCLGIDEYDYLKKLPLSKVVEIHLVRSEGIDDSHFLPMKREYELLDFILKRTNVHYIVIEYHSDPDGIIEGNKQLINFLKEREIHEN